MKKVVILFVLLILAIINFDFVNVKADSIATGLGFSVDSVQYGNAKHYRFTEKYSYIVKNGKSYIYGWSKIKAAVYEDQTDNDWALVIMQTSVTPLDVKIPVGIFNILLNHDSSTGNQNLFSDIDNGMVNFGYGAYITSFGSYMEQPSPRATPDTITYTASIEISKEIKASGSVSFDANELNLYYSHLFSSQVFEVDYEYSCAFFDCSYSNDSTYNKGTYLVDMTYANPSTAGSFVNKIYLVTTFYLTNSYAGGGALYDTPLDVLIYY